MEANPYAAPASAIDDAPPWDAHDLEHRKSSRGKRLGAVLLDGLINGIWIAPLGLGLLRADRVKKGAMPGSLTTGLMLLGLGLMVVLIVINCVMVHLHGQTLGKRALDIAIVRTNGERVSLRRYIFLRVLPVGVVGAIPYAGWLMALGDPLMIFGQQRRCLHDLIADTIVVDV